MSTVLIPILKNFQVMKEGKVLHSCTYEELKSLDRESEAWHFIQKYCLTPEEEEEDDGEKSSSGRGTDSSSSSGEEEEGEKKKEEDGIANGREATEGEDGSALTSAERMETKYSSNNNSFDEQ